MRVVTSTGCLEIEVAAETAGMFVTAPSGHSPQDIPEIFYYHITISLTNDDEGKRVVEADGAEVGVIAAVRHGTAHVEAELSVVEKMKTELESGRNDENTYALSEAAIEKIEDDRVVLQTRG